MTAYTFTATATDSVTGQVTTGTASFTVNAAPWDLLQSAAGAVGYGTSAATFAANLTTGSKLIAACVTQDSGITTTAVKDAAGNAFAEIANVQLGGTRGELSLWVLDTPSADAGTMATVTMTASAGSNSFVLVQEVANLLAGDTVAVVCDGTPATAAGAIATGASTAVLSYATTETGEYLLSCASLGEATYTVPANLTADADNIAPTGGYFGLGLAFGNSTGGSESAIWADTAGSDQYGVILVAFKLAGGGGTVAVPAAPAGLASTGQTSSSVSLAWTAPSGAVTGYDIDRDSVQAATVQGTAYTDTGLSASTSYTYAVAAYNSAGTGPLSATLQVTTPAAPAPGSLPSGVTLVPIDGGPAYYADNGFTYAVNVDSVMAAAGAKSWDDPTWFPIGNFWSFYPYNSITTFKALGLNFSNVNGPNMDMTLLHDNGIWNIEEQVNTNIGNETIGWHVEEPGSWDASGDTTSVVYQVNNMPGALPGRFLQTCFTAGQLGWNSLSGAPGAGTMPYVMGTDIATSSGNVHLTLPGADKYWFATQNMSQSQSDGGVIEMGTAGATPDQMARGTNYGDQIDLMREWVASSPAVPAPVWPAYVENDDGLLASQGGVVIQPTQMNWAVWSELIHGARAICYFSSASDNNWSVSYGFGTAVQTGQVISNYDQAVVTNALVQNLAQILNSQFAVGYATASPAAYSFGNLPLVSVAHGRNGWGVTGIDIMVKAFQGAQFSNAAGTFGPGFYIFATYRGSQTATGVPVTFTTADGYSGSVACINADGGNTSYGGAYTLTAANGVFSDTFAVGSSVRIYHIPYVF